MATFSAEMLRLCRINNTLHLFIESLCNLKDRILKQGAKIEGLKRSIVKTYNKHFMEFIKFGTDLNNILKLLNL